MLIKRRLDHGVYELALAHPPCNEIGTTMLAALEEQLEQIDPTRGRALILHSTLAGGFCAGADLRELHAAILTAKDDDRLQPLIERAISTIGVLEGSILPCGSILRQLITRYKLRRLEHFLDRVHRVMNAFDSLPIPTIGAIHGVCFGGGFELALTCDLLVADATARFCFPELRLGLIPGFGGIPRLKRELGNAPIRDLLLTGRSINAKRAAAAGLVSQVVAPGMALEVARRTARRMLSLDQDAASSAKAFAKSIPHAALAEEKKVFLRLFARPQVFDALGRFVESRDLRPYL